MYGQKSLIFSSAKTNAYLHFYLTAKNIISKHFKIRWFIVSYSPVCYVCFYLILAEKCIKFALYHLLLRPFIRKYECVREVL